MSRINSHEEDWDRQKAYLLRNLLREDNLQLSTIVEEEISNDSTPYNAHSTSVGNKQSETLLQRSDSPLPPLIIEKEPNKHDEPEEYYLKLEKKIMKAYRRIFCDAVEESDSDISDRSIPSPKYSKRRASFGETNNECESTDEDTRTKEVNESKIELIEPDQHNDRITLETLSSSSAEIYPKSTTDLQSDVTEDVGSNSSDSYGNNKEKENTNDKLRSSLSAIASAESIQETDTSTSITCDISYRQITFKADVHRSGSEEIIQNVPSPIYEQNVSTSSSSSTHESQQELEKNDVSANNLLSNSSEEDNSQEIEVMRAARLYTDSDGSLRSTFAGESPRNENLEKEGTKRHLEPEIESKSSEESVINEMDYEDSIDNDVLLTTLSNGVLHCETAFSKDMTRKRKTSASKPITKKHKKDVGIQAGLNERIGDNLIAKIYRVYNLCSCVNHVCRA